MARITGTYRITRWDHDEVRAFVPAALPPQKPPLTLDAQTLRILANANAALGNLSVAANMVPNAEWFLYGFVRKEALITSQIEGTQATFQDVLTFEAGEPAPQSEGVGEVCNYIAALTYARQELARPKGLPLGRRLLCEAHRRLMKGTRGNDKEPGEIRRSQNWIGGSRPGNARFVPPPPEAVSDLLSTLEKWLHAEDPLPPLVRVGLAHVQFETIHPFLDGNGRIGRLLIALLLEHWGLLHEPLLYLSVAFKRHQGEYYEHLNAVRLHGDWEGWTRFFLSCIEEAADDAVTAAQRLFTLTVADRTKVSSHAKTTVAAVRLAELLPAHPIVTLSSVCRLLNVSKPTAVRSIDFLQAADILRETTGKRRDRIYAYHHYLKILTPDTQ